MLQRNGITEGSTASTVDMLERTWLEIKHRLGMVLETDCAYVEVYQYI